MCDVTFCIVCSIGDLNKLTMCLEFISLVIHNISIAWAESSTEWHFWLPVTWRPFVCRVSFNSTHSHLLLNNHLANFNQSCQNSSLGLFVYLFVCLWFYIQIENFSFISKSHHYWLRAENFDLCSALMTIEQWGFFSVPHILWHGASVYSDNFWGLYDTHICCQAFDSRTVTTCFYDLGLSRLGFQHPSFRMRGKRSP